MFEHGDMVPIVIWGRVKIQFEPNQNPLVFILIYSDSAFKNILVRLTFEVQMVKTIIPP